MDKVLAFLKANPVFYFATVDGDKPRVRPFGFVMPYENRLYFGAGTHKAVYRQLKANPNVEICTADKEGRWVRISGTVKMDDRETAREAAFAAAPMLRNIYTKENGLILGLFHFERGQAVFDDMKGGREVMEF